MLDYKEKLNSLYTSDVLESFISKKLSEYSSLIDRETALFLIAKENGLVSEQTADSESAPRAKGKFSIKGTITRIFPLREYPGDANSGSKKTFKSQRLWVSDEKGIFTLVLWSSDTELTRGKIGLFDEVRINGAYFRNGEVNLGFGGKVEKVGGLPTTALSSLPSPASETCNVQGEISEIYPEFFYKRPTGEEAMMRSFDLTDGKTTVNVSVWHEPGQLSNFKFKDKVRIENAKYRKSSLQLNSTSRLVLLERKDEEGTIRGILEDAFFEDEKLIARISGKTHKLAPESALSLLSLSPLPDDIALSTALELKKKEILGKEVVVRL